jgi:anthranilate phosphoribosyltransferase
MMLQETIGRIAAGEDLSFETSRQVFERVMNGQCSPQEIALLLTGLRMKGESVEEIAGAAAALRMHMTPIRSQRTGLVDTCGTGGDGSATFNISTAAALVTAAAGVPVAKHGNRKITSRSGSADVLQALGVNIEADVPRVEKCLEELGICFCFAPLLHQAMKQVSEVRKQLEMPTIFNLLGPLTNPAGAPYQVLGVGHPELRPRLAQALALLGTKHAVVVCGTDGLDEVTLSGVTQVTEIGVEAPRELFWHPGEFGIESQPLDTLKVENAQQSAAIILGMLSGQRGAPRDIVILNAAAALWTAGAEPTLKQAAARAADAIDSGAAGRLLASLVEWTNS